MARKTFISYKYDEAQGLRDKIIEAMGDDATYYKGETSDSPDLTDNNTETIRRKLKDMIYGTSVTIVIISPNMKESKWIDWEIEYSLKNISRDGRYSHTNGIVGVIMKVNGGYDWFKHTDKQPDGCEISSYDDKYLFDIIKKNRYNQNPKVYSCKQCRSFDALNGSYIAFVEEDDFIKNVNMYIENAYNKSLNNASGYDLVKQKN